MNKTNYFTSVQGIRVLTNCTKEQAIARSIKEHSDNETLGGIEIGIGRTKIKDGKRMYRMIPYFYYI